MFIDIHNHIIPNIDDGSDSMNTSLAMLKTAAEEGISRIIATPHFIYGSINNTAQYIPDSGARIAQAALEAGIEMYFGSEVFMCPELEFLVRDGSVCRLNGSRYVLIELPMLSVPEYTKDILFQLQLQGFTPIIAHPERNKVFQANQDQLFALVERGILTQVNSTSLNRLYGKDILKIAMSFIECGLVHFVGTDAHTNRGRAPKMLKAYNTIVSEFGKDAADKLFITNGQCVIENKDLMVDSPAKKKKNFFISLFSFN